jgi:hypothetical protein
VDGGRGDGACVDGADMGVVVGPGVFDDGGGAVLPVAESDGETTGESDGETTGESDGGTTGGAVAGRATGTVCGVLGG